MSGTNSLPRRTPSEHGKVLASLASVGLLASLVLTHDKIEALKAAARGETFSAGCDLNAFVSCSAVVGSAQSELFGFPNSFLGIVGFSVVLSLAAVTWLGGRLPLVVLGGLQLGASAAIVLITWLQVQSIVVLQRLCPYCIAVWVVTIPIFVLTTRTFLVRVRPRSRPARFLQDWALLVVLLWYVAVAAAIWFRFGDRLWA